MRTVYILQYIRLYACMHTYVYIYICTVCIYIYIMHNYTYPRSPPKKHLQITSKRNDHGYPDIHSSKAVLVYWRVTLSLSQLGYMVGMFSPSIPINVPLNFKPSFV